MSVEKVRLGSLGLGWWGSELADAVKRSGDGELVSCFSRGEEGRRAFAERHGCRAAETLEEFLADDEIEGVLIATSHQSHRQLIEAVAAAGKHIFVEKPLTTTVADGRACVEASEAAGVILQVGHQRRRTAANRRIRSMLDDGELGDIEVITANQSIPNGFKMPPEAWRWSPEQSPLGSMTSLGVHKIDTIHYLAGPVRAVTALTRAGRDHPIDEATVLGLELASGALATLTTSFFTPVVNEITVHGTAAAAHSLDGGTRLLVQKTGQSVREEVALDPVDPVVDQMSEFARAIRGKQQVEVTGAVALAVIAVLEAAVESAATGSLVEVARV